MRCERLIKCCVFVALLTACSREAPAPAQVATTSDEAPAAEAPAAPRHSYADAITWFRTTPGFQFLVEENGVKAEGDMERPNIGAERVKVTVNGEQWTAEAGPKGVVWKRDGKEMPAPDWGNRLYQRVTVAFDPQKNEREAQLIEKGHYRFTDANSGALHDVWVNDDGQIARMTIAPSMSMTLTHQK